MSFFVASPFTSPVGQKIEQATDASLPSENWTLNMEICDIINESEDGPKDAIKAIRKRLQQNAGKNYTVVMYTLTVLETCVKNCDKKFHVLVCNKEFVQELVKLIGPKNGPPTAIQEKVLSLIQSWADAFYNHSDLSGVVQVYTDLKHKGIEFPMTDLDAMAPIHTPQRSVPDVDINLGGQGSVSTPAPVSPSIGMAGTGSPKMVSPHNLPQTPAPPQVPPVAAATLTPDQLGKLQSELDVVQGNMMVLSEMLSELTPGKEHPSDMELLQELHGTCQAMQHRLVELIGKLANDEITAELLRVNDELNNLFLRYSRFENNRSSHITAAGGATKNLANVSGGAVANASATSTDTAEKSDTTGDALIDLDVKPSVGVPSITSKVAAFSLDNGNVSSQRTASDGEMMQSESLKTLKDKEDKEFDMFAQSRNVTYETSKTGGSTYQDNLDPDQVNGSLGAVAQSRSQPVLQNERDFDEMAAWLSDKPSTGGHTDVPEESLTSSEFERFLAERAAAADALPAVTSNTTRTVSSSSTRPHHRQLNKEADSENSLFAL